MGIFDFLNKQTTEFKFNNKTLRIAVKNWCENEISAIKKYCVSNLINCMSSN